MVRATRPGRTGLVPTTVRPFGSSPMGTSLPLHRSGLPFTVAAMVFLFRAATAAPGMLAASTPARAIIVTILVIEPPASVGEMPGGSDPGQGVLTSMTENAMASRGAARSRDG